MTEQRQSKRFDLYLPVEVIRSGAERVSTPGKTRNISSGGVLFTSESQMEIGGPIEYVITLAAVSSGIINIRCMGKVLRMERIPPAIDSLHQSFQVAASLERYEFLRTNSEAA